MRIYNNNGEYDLPAGFALEIEKKNPFFNSIGEKSLPITLPLTCNNKKLIGYANILGKNKPAYKFNVTIEDGVNIYQAKQVIHSISSAGISCTFYLGISRFWNLANVSKIRDLLGDKIYVSSDLQGDLIRSMDFAADFDFVVFPAAVKLSGDTIFILNETEIIDGALKLIGRNARVITEGELKTSCPAGYGISAFAKANRFLKIIINKLGYSLEPSFLDTAPFNQMVFLNNVADLITINKIKWRCI